MSTRRPKVPRAANAGADRAAEPDTGAPGPHYRPAGSPAGSPASSNSAVGGPAGKPKVRTGQRPAAAAKVVYRHSPEAPTKGPKPVPARAFSGRLLALAVVLLTITVLLAPSIHTYLQQRAQISALEQDISGKQQQQTDLKNEAARWSDPAYIKQQARDRVNMLMPGETGYWVYGADGSGPTSAETGSSPAPSGAGETLPWVDGLIKSIKRSAAE
ncbi:septum formation initiator family protein [Paeniglutamicibacter antarcticus]|uniref:Septum formation initiator family protein n=1 Tax=Arthrobacter terrae TaxID=2935737 RepID=A0A931GAI9_9MICC|nr:septum formation initiator family protein [Arthrobacter terrae]MBG0739782.1 septum formation initiator family protein [Arthrobacter terrae]